ncbi:MAG: VCBS repeat-containing protein [Planctomycetota bacterium]|nr:VCBS repeat-containing protein [Planctomycetota bacterium]
MTRRLLVLASVALVLAGVATGAPSQRELSGIETVDGLQIADVSPDGIPDLLLLEGHTLRVWHGKKGALPGAEPAVTYALPEGTSFVDAMAGAPAALAVGTQGVLLLDLTGRAPARWTKTPHAWAPSWRDRDRAVFADIHRGDVLGKDDWLYPEADGWTLVTEEEATLRLRLTPFLDIRSPGPFLEDTCDLLHALPEVFVGVGATQGSKDKALWAIDGRSLVAQGAKGRVRYDLSFLSAEAGATFDQTLVDLDGDERPDVLHRIHTNREARYGFFRTRPAAEGAATGPSHKPATSALFLSGFQLDPDLVDLDGDGLKDLVVTSMQVNAPNMLGALTSGKVTAETRAFLNRWKAGKGAFFESKPDAVVKSQIGVKVQFNYAGNIEVLRSFTILLDGDFDGDGRKDLAIRTSPDTISIRRGVAEGVWAGDKTVRAIKIPPKGRHPDVDGRVADLDGDGKDEIVLIYRKAPGGRDRVFIIDPDL